MKILLMEDELHLRLNIKKFLILKGHEVDDFENGEEIIQNVNPNDYDYIILDINTPQIDGFELLEYLRKIDIMTPTIFISALTNVDKILKAFELGAEDYLKKPFDLAELEIRMMRNMPNFTNNHIIDIGEEYRYDLDKRTLIYKNHTYKLSSIQKKIIYLLIKNQNDLVTFDMLIDYAWDNKEISHNTILSTLRGIKKILPKHIINNIKGEGYIFYTKSINNLN